MEDSDKEEICGLDTKHHSGLAERYASCKLKLQHAMQQNWQVWITSIVATCIRHMYQSKVF